MKTRPVVPDDWWDRPLPANVTVGLRSTLYSAFAFLHHRSTRTPAVTIGDDSGVYNPSHFELGPDGEVEIGNYCTIVGAIISTNGRVVIEDYAFIAHEVVIADTVIATPSPTDAPLHRPSVVVGRNAWIGMRATLVGGARLGEGAILGAGAVLDTEIPDYAIAAGNPARVVGTVPRSARERQ